MRYMILVSRASSPEEIVKALEPAVGARAREVAMTLGQRLVNQGRREGREALLFVLLQRRFGPLPPAIQQRIRAATAVQLDRWAESVLSAASIEDVFPA